MNRRDFIKSGLTVSAGLALGGIPTLRDPAYGSDGKWRTFEVITRLEVTDPVGAVRSHPQASVVLAAADAQVRIAGRTISEGLGRRRAAARSARRRPRSGAAPCPPARDRLPSGPSLEDLKPGEGAVVDHDGCARMPRRLFLADHDLAAAGGRGPVDAAQRLAPLVLPHAVEVESRRPAQEQPPSLRRPRPGLREEPVDVDEPRVDEDRALRGQLDLDPFEPYTYEDVLAVARHIKVLLDQLGLSAYPKTSGATGLQIYVPVKRGAYTYGQVRAFVGACGRMITKADPDRVSLESAVNVALALERPLLV